LSGIDKDRAARLVGNRQGPGRDLEAGDQPLDVPFEGTGVGLVEVVDVELQRPFGRREPAEVGEVRVTARLDAQPAVGL
jgi:hypothetical protein